MTNRASKIPDENITRPHLSLYEGWQDESGIDTNIWTPTNPATGTAWAIGQNGARLLATANPNANENCRLVTVHRWPAYFGNDVGENQGILRKLIAEWQMSVGSASVNVDTANFFVGFSATTGATRTTTYLTGFGMRVDAGTDRLNAVVDNNGTELTAELTAQPSTFQKLRIELALDRARFFVNESLVAELSGLPAAMIQRPGYLNFYNPTGAGGASLLTLGAIRIWNEDVLR